MTARRTSRTVQVMLLLALLLLAGSIALYALVPALLIHWTYPLPVYALMLASIGVAVSSRRRGILRWLTIGLSGAVTVVFLVATLVLSQLHRGALTVHPGDPFPDFSVLTSTHQSFSPSQLNGRSAALYIFYRGDW